MRADVGLDMRRRPASAHPGCLVFKGTSKMDSTDLEVLRGAIRWHRQGQLVWLITVVATWGSGPRQPGAMMAINSQGSVLGSVSGGCLEDDLVDRVRNQHTAEKPELLTYGITGEEAARFGIPCGGQIRILVEPLTSIDWTEEVLLRIERHELVARTFDIRTGQTTLQPSMRGALVQFDGTVLKTIYGPRWRLLIIGAGQTSRMLAEMAKALDFEVLICDPRQEYAAEWKIPGTRIVPGMPDDVVVEIQPDPHTAIVALTHDPKLDDMALLEALRSNAFYVGALGSKKNQQKRRERLMHFELSATDIARLHGPVGLPIGSRTPGEIALSVMAEIIAEKNSAHVTPDAQSTLNPVSCIGA
jgi:xanthine dehydrogenase accessory factor